MSDEINIKYMNVNSEKPDTDHILLEGEENKGVCGARIREKGEGKMCDKGVRQTSAGTRNESEAQSKDLCVGSSGGYPIQRREYSNVLKDSKQDGKYCDKGATEPKELHVSLEGKMQNPSNPLATLEEGLLVPDGGWGWLVAIGAFIITMLCKSLVPSFSILFSGYLLEKGTSSVTTAWIFNIQWSIWYLVAPVVRPLAVEFGWRRIGYLGAFMFSASLMLSAFSPSAQFLFFSYSLLTGCGGGLLFGMCFMALPLYFDQRRGLANTFLMAGMSMGQIAIAPFVRYLVDNYSFKDAALLYGATILNAFVAVSLFQPVKWHMKKPRRKMIDPSPERLATTITQNESSEGPQEHLKLPDAVLQCEGTEKEPDWASVAYQTKVKGTRCGTTSQRMSECSQHSVIRNDASPGIIVPDTVCTHPENKEDSRGNGCFGVMKKLWAILVRVARTTKSDARILRSRRALVLSLVTLFTLNCLFNFMMVVPFAMNTKGHTLEVSAWCISVLGICNLITRLVLSPLADWKRFDIRLAFMSGSVVMGSAVLVFSFVTNIMWITLAFAAFGCGLGATLTFTTLVMIKYMGIEDFAATYGVSSLVSGCGFPFVGAIIGFTRDITGSYTISLWMIAALSYMSFTLWLFMPAAVAYDNRNIVCSRIRRCISETYRWT